MPLVDPNAGAHTLQGLCLGCGLCCDGTLFECAELESEEEAVFSEVNLIRSGGKVALPLPCPKHVDRCCTVYQRRPITCSRFACKLYDAVESGGETLVEAQDRIAHVREMCALIEQLLDWSVGSFSTTRFRLWVSEFPGGEVEARRLHPQAFLKYGLLRVGINRHFLPLLGS